MPGIIAKNLDQPDSREQIDLGMVELVSVGSVQVGREILEPGWRWSIQVQPIVGTERCEFHHVGYQISGRVMFEDRDGVQVEIGPGDVYDVSPGHDAWVVGEEPSVSVDFQGVAGWGLPPAVGQRMLGTVLFTDIVGSTAALQRMGDRRWGTLLRQHDEDVRRLVAEHRGKVVKSTGDGHLAVFDQPAAAVRSARAIRDSAGRLGISLRCGLHTGETEREDDDLRGVAVHLAARVMEQAEPDTVLVSATTFDLISGTDLAFTDLGEFELKGISGLRRLYRLGDVTGGDAG